MIATGALTDYSSDRELARRAANGDRRAQQALFRQLRRTVHATLYRALGSNRHMEDLLQESFIEVFRSLDSYRGEAKLTTWADRITLRVALHHLRRQSARRRRELDPGHSWQEWVGSPEEQLEHRQGITRLHEALGKLSPEHQIAFALFALDGRSIEEIAVITGVSRGAAKSRVSRGRRNLWAAARRDDVLMRYLSEGVQGGTQ